MKQPTDFGSLDAVKYYTWDERARVAHKVLVVYRLECRGSISGNSRDLSLLHSFQTGSGIHPGPIQWVPGFLTGGKVARVTS